MNSFKSTVLVCFTILTSCYFLKEGFQNFNRHERVFSVRGLAEKEVNSNLAIWKISFNLSSDKNEVVRKSLPEIQLQIQNFLLENGFKNEEITKASSIKDRQSMEYGAEKGNRFVANGTYSITTNNVELVEKTEQKVDELLKKGIVITGNQKNYYFTDLNGIKPMMLDEATKNAKEAANGFAKSMNVEVGKLKSASQGIFTIENPISGDDFNGTDRNSSLKKKVRVVTQVDFYIK